MLQQALQTLVLVAGVFVLWEGGMALREFRRTQHTLATKAGAALNETTLTMKNLREASAAWKSASEAQSTAATVAAREMGKDLQKLGVAIDRFNELTRNTDATINGTLGPQTAEVLRAAQGAVGAVTDDARALQPVIEDAETTSHAIASTVPETLEGVKVISRNLAAMSDDTHGMTTDARAYVHRMTAPVHGFWNFVKSIGVEVAKIVVVFAK